MRAPASDCPAPLQSTDPVELDTLEAFPNLGAFSAPVALLQAPGDPTRWFLVEQAGRVLQFANDPGVSTTSVFIDITDSVENGGEAGLLGMAFHPHFQTNGVVFLSYTRRGAPLVSYVSRFRSPDQGQTLEATSEVPLFTVDQPFRNHNGGNLAFGPDGLLYIGFGDGGSAGDPRNAGQNTHTLLGKMLRVDVDTGNPYAIPPDNPFASSASCDAGAGCPEIYAWGLRNPWRWSFDRVTGDLWVGDVGQNRREEVNRVERGGNYGWRCFEGNAPFNTTGCAAASQYIPPVTDYDHSLGHSITGGYVYRGSAIPSLVGTYIFGDFGSGRLWGLSSDAQGQAIRNELLDTDFGISSFGEGLNGELYILDYFGGRVYRLVATNGCS